MNRIASADPQRIAIEFFASFRRMLEALQGQERIMIGLSGGASLSGAYAYLNGHFSEIPSSIRLKMRFCLLDERMVGEDDDRRNSKLLNEVLIGPLVNAGSIPQDAFLLPDFGREDFLAEYSARVGAIDIGLIGVGEDGHICSLFPQHPLLDERGKHYLHITDSPKDPPVRITVSPDMLRSIHSGFIFFIGASKRQALIRFLSDAVDSHDCPAKIIAGSESVCMVTDLVDVAG